MPQHITTTLAGFFSRLFPRTKDIDVHVDSSTDESNVYVDVSLRHGGLMHRFENLRQIPARIRVGGRYFRISQKNRHTLTQLSNLDPRFDPQRGFVFPERDVPEILKYLRPKATVTFSNASQRIHIDDKPLQYEREVSKIEDEVEVKTSMVSSDTTVRIETPQDVNFTEGSKYVHAVAGYFKKPQEKKLKTIPEGAGKTRLHGDQIPFFLLHDLKRIESEPRTKVADDVRSQRVLTGEFQPKVSLEVDGPWIWFDVRYEADKFNVPYREMENLDPVNNFIRHDETWIQADKKTHARMAGQIGEIPEVEAIDERFRTRTYHFDEVQSLLEQVASGYLRGLFSISQSYRGFFRN